MKPLQIVPTCTPSFVARIAAHWPAADEQRTPMGGRIIRLGAPAHTPLWVLALLATAPMLLVGMATMV